MSNFPPIPVNVITGPLGVGKTTAIARLLAGKPRDEAWLVVLNEFTDTGIDVVTLAAATSGAYDLRMIPGGCLCCTGEADFRQQLSAVLAQDPAWWPKRILVEPSGIGHPGAMVEELRLFERNGSLRLASVIALIDAPRVAEFDMLDATSQAQIAAADVVLLAKADLATEMQRTHFNHWAERLFPPKRFVGLSERGELPAEAVTPPVAEFSFARVSLSRPARHEQAHAHAPQVTSRSLCWSGIDVQAMAHRLLQRSACGWIIPNSLLFDAAQLQTLLADELAWRPVERFKAVLRTGIEQWHLVQRWPGGFDLAPTQWRQDSRIEVQLQPGEAADWDEWDRRWQRLSERCPVA